jgi:hypothetical protein
VDFVTQPEQIVGEVASVLAGDSGDKYSFGHARDCSAQVNMDFRE